MPSIELTDYETKALKSGFVPPSLVDKLPDAMPSVTFTFVVHWRPEDRADFDPDNYYGDLPADEALYKSIEDYAGEELTPTGLFSTALDWQLFGLDDEDPSLIAKMEISDNA
jgi:hypothetical protein